MAKRTSSMPKRKSSKSKTRADVSIREMAQTLAKIERQLDEIYHSGAGPANIGRNFRNCTLTASGESIGNMVAKIWDRVQSEL